MLSLTFADIDYLGLADVWFLDLDSRRSWNRSVIGLLGQGFDLPHQVGGGSMRAQQRGFQLGITEVDDGTRLTASVDDGAFEADILVTRPGQHETMSVVIPWGERRFQCTTKENTRPATGTVSWDRRTWTFGDGDAWGCLDYGRGKWPYRTAWNWGSASGRSDERTVGLQLGGKWTVGTGMTENALCIDGRLTKISEELEWTYDTTDWLRPWRIRTPASSVVDLTFTPVHDKRSRLELGAASSTVHQCFGTYRGAVVAENGERVEITDLFGWAEEARWRW